MHQKGSTNLNIRNVICGCRYNAGSDANKKDRDEKPRSCVHEVLCHGVAYFLLK